MTRQILAVVPLLLLGITLPAQDGGLHETPAHPIGSAFVSEPQRLNQAETDQNVAFTGCLTKGTLTVGALTGLAKGQASEGYVLHRDSGEIEQLKGRADLADHVGHVVQLSGTISREE